MSNPAVEITITTDADQAERGFTDAAKAADKLGTSVDKAGAKLDTGASKMTGAADAADGVASKSSQATGALGALSAGFELVGADKYAAGLQQAAMATDFMSGVGDSLNLVLELQSVQWLKNKVATIASTVATKAQSLATKAAAAVQWALNAALNANPIGLVVAAVALLVAGFVLLYKKSDAFRGLIDLVWKGIKTGVGFIGDLVKAIGKIVFPLGFATPFTLMADAIGLVIDGIKSLIGWIGKIKLPKLPGWASKIIPGGNATTSAARVGGTVPVARFTATGVPLVAAGTASSTGGPSIVINVTGAIDPEAVARQIRRVLGRHDGRMGFA